MTLSPQKQHLVLKFLATRWWNEVTDLVAANTDEAFAFDDLDFDLDLREIRRVVSIDDLEQFARLAVNSEIDEEAVAQLEDFGDQGSVDAFAELFAVNLIGVLARAKLIEDFLPVLFDSRMDATRSKILQFFIRNFGKQSFSEVAQKHLSEDQFAEVNKALLSVNCIKSDAVLIHFEGERDRLERCLSQCFKKLGYSTPHKQDQAELEYLTIKRVGGWVSAMLPGYWQDESMAEMRQKLLTKLCDTKALSRVLVVPNGDDWIFEDWRNGKCFDTTQRGDWQRQNPQAANTLDFLQQQRVKVYDPGHPRALQRLDYSSTAASATKQGAVRRFVLVKQ